eukprot:362334-Chlamydomonas_euryale.AAC.3
MAAVRLRMPLSLVGALTASAAASFACHSRAPRQVVAAAGKPPAAAVELPGAPVLPGVAPPPGRWVASAERLPRGAFALRSWSRSE